ncbi:MAG: hypothetical protein WKF75_09815 [Singulisphaera sp.]
MGALLLGGAIVSLLIALAPARPGRATRHVIAIAVMLIGPPIHPSGGRIETHLHVFGRSPSSPSSRLGVLITASAAVTADHLRTSSGRGRSSASSPRARGAGSSTPAGSSSRMSS